MKSDGQRSWNAGDRTQHKIEAVEWHCRQVAALQVKCNKMIRNGFLALDDPLELSWVKRILTEYHKVRTTFVIFHHSTIMTPMTSGMKK